MRNVPNPATRVGDVDIAGGLEYAVGMLLPTYLAISISQQAAWKSRMKIRACSSDVLHPIDARQPHHGRCWIHREGKQQDRRAVPTAQTRPHDAAVP